MFPKRTNNCVVSELAQSGAVKKQAAKQQEGSSNWQTGSANSVANYNFEDLFTISHFSPTQITKKNPKKTKMKINKNREPFLGARFPRQGESHPPPLAINVIKAQLAIAFVIKMPNSQPNCANLILTLI